MTTFKQIFTLSMAVIGVIFFNKYIVKGSLAPYPEFFINTGSYFFSKAESFGGFAEKIKNFSYLASENERLKRNQELVFSLQAKIDNLENENDFLRHVSNLSQKLDSTLIYAGIFNFNLSPAGYNVLLNKGAQDGISEGDVVVTAEGILVGKVQKVMHNFSRVIFVSDPEFKITAKVLRSGTSGIARGALNEGMYLDFVVQADEIKEEDLITSTGNDQFPPALIVGSVENVEVNTAQMFKKVRIRPSVKDVQLGRVLVIKIK